MNPPSILSALLASCYHEITEFDNVPSSYEPLRHLSIPENVNVPWDFSCGIDILDRNRIYINKCGIRADRLMGLCHLCVHHLSRGHQPPEAGNWRWSRFLQWKDTFVAVELLDSINRVSDASADDATRDSFGMDYLDNFFLCILVLECGNYVTG